MDAVLPVGWGSTQPQGRYCLSRVLYGGANSGRGEVAINNSRMTACPPSVRVHTGAFLGYLRPVVTPLPCVHRSPKLLPYPPFTTRSNTYGQSTVQQHNWPLHTCHNQLSLLHFLATVPVSCGLFPVWQVTLAGHEAASGRLRPICVF